MLRLVLLMIVCLFASPDFAEAKGKKAKFHCEIKKNGKTVDDASIKSRKECKSKKGKWVKDHEDHGHDHEGEDHEHDEE